MPIEMHGEWEYKYHYLKVQMLHRKVSIGIQTFGHLSGAEISLGYSKEPLGVRWFGGPNYFRSCVRPSLKKEKQGSVRSLNSEAWIHPALFETAIGSVEVKSTAISPDTK